jgi:23S rRNA pseudouridine1911/1915/1917 synthase
LKQLEVPAELAGERADKAVVEMLARGGETVPRAEVQRWIAAGLVTVAGRAVDKRTALAAGTVVSVTAAAPPPSAAAPDDTVAFAVVYEDEHLVVVDKPAGLVVHPARGHRGGTLVNGLLARGGFERAGADERDPEGHLRPGIVHRLDKDTSGLMVVAKHAAAREALKALFARHDIERAYLAITLGRARAARWDTPHGRHPKSRLRFTSRLDADKPGARRAVTRVEPLESLAAGRASLVRCTLETGRTHQIRVHLSEQAHTPILADPLYGRRPADPDLAAIADALGRQALHAAVLGFVHPITRAAMRWESPLPADLERALEALRAL